MSLVERNRCLLKSCDLILTPYRMAIRKNKKENCTTCEKITDVFKRVICATLAGLIFPFTLSALIVRKIASPKKVQEKKTQKNELLQPSSLKEKRLSEKKSSEEPKNSFEQLKKDLRLSQRTEKKLGKPKSGSWRTYGKKNGKEFQTLEDYQKEQSIAMPNPKPLTLVKIGRFSEADLKIIDITLDFLKIFHCLDADMMNTVLKIEEFKQNWIDFLNIQCLEKKEGRWEAYRDEQKLTMQNEFPRNNGQYNGDAALGMLRILRPEIEKNDQSRHIIAFTNEDLYSEDLNFVFGLAQHYRDGIFSNARFGNPTQSKKDFETALLRMMKISAHEFGHMRGLQHCTDYDCNIGGYINLPELDQRPLLFCSEDSAKICLLTHTPMADYYRNLLKYLESFNAKYKLNCDFSKEISSLKKRISVLTSIVA